MKKKRFTVERIVGILKQAEVGVPVRELVRKEGFSSKRSTGGRSSMWVWISTKCGS